MIFHSGISTIGGTVISLVHGTSRVIFDFGTVYDPASDPYDGTVLRRGRARLRDDVGHGRFPAIDGVHDEDMLDGLPLTPADRSELSTIVLVSHPHQDHMAALEYLSPSVPVYLSSPAIDLLRASEELGECRLGGTLRVAEVGRAITFGPFVIEPIFSDHSAWGSLGFRIDTPDGSVLWTGDYRMHGLGSTDAWRAIDAEARRGVTVLVTEASSVGMNLPGDIEGVRVVPTRTLPAGAHTEEEVMDNVRRSARGPGVRFFNVYHRDVERLLGLISAAEESGRRIAFEPATARLLESLRGVTHTVYLPDVPDGTFPPAVCDLIDRATVVSRAEILASPDQWMVQNSYSFILELMDFAGTPGVYLHLEGTPIGDFDASYARMRERVRHAGLTYDDAGAHALFGHPLPGHLQEVVDHIDPSYVVAVHSLHPRRLVARTGLALWPRSGDEFWLRDGRMEPGSGLSVLP